MLRRVVEARTKKRGRFSFSDSALRHSRRRWSRACCSELRVSVGSGAVRGQVKVSAGDAAVVTWAGLLFELVRAKCGDLSTSVAKCAAFGRDDELSLGVKRVLRGASERQMAMMAEPWVSAMRGPTPAICKSDGMVVGRAMTIAFKTASEKTMKAGLPVLAASDLRQVRRLSSRDFCSEV